MRHRKSAILDKWNEIADNRLKGSVYLALNRYVKDNYSYYVAVLINEEDYSALLRYGR